MRNKTIRINGIPYVACPYLSFGDYDNSCQVERANVRYILDTFKDRVVYHADPHEYENGRTDAWEVRETDTVDRAAWKADWLRNARPCPDAFLAGGYGSPASPEWAGLFVPRPRNALRRVRRAFYRPAAPYVGRSYRYGVACYNRAPWVLHGTGGHGWEYVWVRSDVRAMGDILAGLEDYPSIDDELVSEMESEAETEWLESAYGGYHDVTRAMAKTLAAEYGLDVDDLADVVTVARTRAMWSWEWLDSGPDRADWRNNGQLCFVHESGGPWIDAAKVAARFLAWDAWEDEEDGLHGLVARLVAWLEAAPSVDTPGEGATRDAAVTDPWPGLSDVDCDWGIRWGSPETGIQYGSPVALRRSGANTEGAT